MGQKTHPYGFRLGYNNTWRSRWYADGKDYANLLHEDLQLRQELLDRLENAAVSAVDIERTASKLRVNILSGRPGIIIGRKGAEVDKLRDDLMRRYAPRASRSAALDASTAPRSRVPSGISRVACRCTPSRRTSITVSRPRTPPTA